ncbi:hypothetical protein FACS1894170_01320 [Planctomycetales bacterium]|nr:hypothetical protein FACS1894170_01320 [Planctomycetales bacterium]
MRKLTYCSLLFLLAAMLFSVTVSAATEITAEKAKEIALAKTGSGTVTECRLDYEHGRKVYEIEIINGDTKYEMDVCVTDSQIYDYKFKTYSDYNTTGATEISADKAKRIAFAETRGGTVTGCKLDFEHGRKVYEIDITNGDTKYEIDVCVTDSKIHKFEQRTIAASRVPVSGGRSEISAERAKEIALAKTDGGTVVECGLDYEHGRKVYEIEIINGNTKYEMDVCVTDSQIYDYEQETISQARDTKPVANTAGGSNITAEKAKEIALSKVGGGTVSECKLDYERGKQVYEIEIKYNGREYEVDVDVAAGNIVKYKIDD